MWGEVSFWSALLLFGVAPGYLTLTAVGVRWSLGERLAASFGVSLALVSFTAHALSAVGLRVNAAWGVVGVTVLVSAAFWLGARHRAASHVMPLRRRLHAGLHFEGEQALQALAVLGCAVAVYLLLEPIRATALLPPSVDDGVHHATWFRLIYERQTLSPAAIYAPPVSGAAGGYYPWGLHAWIAMLADVARWEPIETYRRAILLVGCCLPLSVYALAGRFLPRGWPRVAASVVSVFFWWLPFQPFLWGGYPLLAGAAGLLPVARLVVEALERRNGGAVALACVAGVGLLLIHPSQAMGALLVAVALATGAALRERLSWRAAGAALGAVALVGGLLVLGSQRWAPLERFVTRAERTAYFEQPKDWEAGISTASRLRELYLAEQSQPVISALCAIGAVIACTRAVWRELLLLHLLLLSLLPLALARSWVTTFWYHANERLWYLQIVAAPLLGALGLWGCVALLRALPWAWLAKRRGAAALWVAALLGVAFCARGYTSAVERRFKVVGDMMLTDHRPLRDFAWIREQIPKREVLLNISADYGLVLPFTGRMVAFPNCQIGRYLPEYERALQGIRRRLASAVVRQRLEAAGLRYIYEGFFRTDLEIPPHRPHLAAHALRSHRWLSVVYESPTARIYRVRPPGD